MGTEPWNTCIPLSYLSAAHHSQVDAGGPARSAVCSAESMSYSFDSPTNWEDSGTFSPSEFQPVQHQQTMVGKRWLGHGYLICLPWLLESRNDLKVFIVWAYVRPGFVAWRNPHCITRCGYPQHLREQTNTLHYCLKGSSSQQNAAPSEDTMQQPSCPKNINVSHTLMRTSPENCLSREPVDLGTWVMLTKDDCWRWGSRHFHKQRNTLQLEQSQKRRLRGHLITMFWYLMGGYKENGDSLFTQSDMENTRGNRHR